MAAQISPEEAAEFCRQDLFRDRIRVAAINSRTNVTLSGDADAIEQAKALLHNAGKFARILKVEKAYHSHHMEMCAPQYLASLQHESIQPYIERADTSCKWFSSVYGANGRSFDDIDSFRDAYWIDNLVKPVLFYQAVERAVKEDFCFDMALEVGPHPALQGPVMETLKSLTGVDIPYHGVLERDKDSLTVFASTLAFIWKTTGPSTPVPDFDGFNKACNSRASREGQLLKGLPSYAWDHDETLPQRPSTLNLGRFHNSPPHELLGRIFWHGDGHQEELHWRNILKLGELPWLRGHQVQEHVVLPAAAYLSMAIDAALYLALDHSVMMVELNHIQFIRAISFDEQLFPSGAECHFTTRVTHREQERIVVDVSCYSSNLDTKWLHDPSESLLNFTGKATVIFSRTTKRDLPTRATPDGKLKVVHNARFYNSLSRLGIQYSGSFLAKSIRRRSKMASVLIHRPETNKFLVHPAVLDTAFHGLLAAHSFSSDGKMCVPFLPSSVDSLRIDVSSWSQEFGILKEHTSDETVADCYLRSHANNAIRGDVDLFRGAQSCCRPWIQLQGLALTRTAPADCEEDRQIFSRVVWQRDISAGLEPAGTTGDSDSHPRLYEKCERTAYFFLRKTHQEIHPDEVPSLQRQFQCFMHWVTQHMLPKIETGQHPRVYPEWSDDDSDTIMAWKDEHPDSVELRILHAVGSSLPAMVRGTLPALQVMMEDNALQRLYTEGAGFSQANDAIGQLVGQISHRYPRIKVLEIGAGTGATTRAAVQHLGAMSSYTFTDISSGFLENAQHNFPDKKMRFCTLEIDRSPLEQGFEAHSFDLIIASNVLHATRCLSDTMSHCRQLLKSGGNIIMMELTSEALYIPMIFACLPGWWVGQNDGRTLQPTIPEPQWDDTLKHTGFSGLDCVVRDCKDNSEYIMSVMVAQAVNSRVSLLRQPLDFGLIKGAPEVHGCIDNLVILDGASSSLDQTSRQLIFLLAPYVSAVHAARSLDDLGHVPRLGPRDAVVCLLETEGSVLDRITANGLASLKSVLTAGHVLWVTKGCHAKKPLTNMMIGIGRSAMMETSHLRIQFVDITSDIMELPSATMLSEMLLRMVYLGLDEFSDIRWTSETEVALRNGLLYIPRIRPDEEFNLHLNSLSRDIKNHITIPQDLVCIAHQNGSYGLEQLVEFGSRHGDPELVDLRVHTSSICALSVLGHEPLYICQCSIAKSQECVLALSTQNASTLRLPPGLLIAWNPHNQLREVLAFLLCHSLLAGIPESATCWFHDAADDIIKFALALGVRTGVKIFISSSSPAVDTNTTFIHETISQRKLEVLLPPDLHTLVSFSVRGKCGLIEALPTEVRHRLIVRYPAYEAIKYNTISLAYGVHELRRLLKEHSISSDLGTDFVGTAPEPKVGPVDITSISQHSAEDTRPTSIVDWTNAQRLTAIRQSLQFRGLFDEHKTYFLVGLSGEIGMSLVEWMADHGAKHFAVASRQPKVDPTIIRRLQNRMVNLRVLELDVADKLALQGVYQELSATMPPIAGVANGAMVLHDTTLEMMSLDNLQNVLRPKVTGTKNLDELFYEAHLDFFIMFSSMASIVGNQGQSNYGAANLFLSALAAQRRNRGVAASVIHLGCVQGLGYLSNTQESVNDFLIRRLGLAPVSETDLHIIFAQAIVTGRPSSMASPDLLAGFANSVNTDIDERLRCIPLLSHCFLEHQTGRQTEQTIGQASVYQVRSQIMETKSSGDALCVLEAAFSTKLGLLLHTSTKIVKNNVPLISLGIDSLVAVEIRSWFLEELSLDVPIFKILSGATLQDVCRDVISRSEIFSSQHVDGSSIRTSFEARTAVRSSRDESPMTASTQPGSDTPASTVDLSSSARSHPSDQINIESVPDRVSHITVSDIRIGMKRTGKMSQSQRQLYFLHAYLDDKSAYTVAHVGRYDGEMDFERFESALHKVSMQHEALRSSYFIDQVSGQAVQTVNDQAQISLVRRSISDVAELEDEVTSQRHFVFNIEHGSTMKITVLSESASVHHIIFLYHHIVMDKVSWFLFNEGIHRAYSAQKLDQYVQQPIEMSIKEESRVAGSQESLEFWDNLYHDTRTYRPLPLFPFSKTKTRQILKSHDVETFDMELPTEVTALVKQRALELHATPFHVYLAALAIFVSQSLDTADFSMGIAHANRPDMEDMSTMGYFLNLVPLRFRVSRGTTESFSSITQQTRDMVLATTSHASAPLADILDRLAVPRSASHHPLFQVVLNYRQGYDEQSPLGNGSISWYVSSKKTITARNPYDMAFDITEISGRTILHLSTQRYLYDARDSLLIMSWYMQAVETMCQRPSEPLGRYSLFTQHGLQHAVVAGQGPSAEIEWKGSLFQRFQAMADEHPDFVALSDVHSGRLTYRQMIGRVRQITRLLCRTATALEPGSHVAVLLNPSSDQVCALLAILSLRLVYVPLDIRNPQERLCRMLSDCRPHAILYNKATEDISRQLSAHVAMSCSNVDDSSHLPTHELENFLPEFSGPSEPAIIIYTSGSTGVPKGVVLSHGNILDYVHSVTTLYGLGCHDVMLQQSPLGFDISLDQTFNVLLNGGTLVIVGQEGRGDPMHLARRMLAEGVTYTIFSNSEFLALLRHGYHILRQCTAWRLAVHGGEKLPPHLWESFSRLELHTLRLIHAYGPAECTIVCAVGILPDSKAGGIPIPEKMSGRFLRPMPNHSIMIADDQLRPVPSGFPGEICISGAGVSAGYLNRPDETRNKFVQCDPSILSTANSPRSQRVYYRTGDMGRLLQDGSLQVFGRMAGDNQVKVRGQRVELDEIAIVIVETADGAISNAAVSYRSDPDLLVAIVVYSDIAPGDERTTFTQKLKTRLPLPGYMSPSHYVAVDAIPMTINGKQDRTAIDQIAIDYGCQPMATALDPGNDNDFTAMELEIKQIWSEVLSKRRERSSARAMTRSSDFFHIGGNSMLGIEVRSLLQQHYGVTIPLPTLFQISTISAMAAHVQSILAGEISTKPSVMDWDAEVGALLRNLDSQLPKDMTLTTSNEPESQERVLSVLLTGATGFLGTRILQDLVRSPAVEAIYCVAIRPDESGAPRHVSVQSSKITEYYGDLAQPQLGLSEDDFRHLSQAADIIIHNGASVSFLQDYHSLRGPNVVSTRTLCQLALPRQIPFHFISSASVAAVSQAHVHADDDPGRRLTLTAPLPPVSISSSTPRYDPATAVEAGIHGYGYGVTKWVSEALLERVGAEYGLPYWIHRPASIVGEGAPPLDLVGAIFGFSRMIGAAPAMDRLSFCGSFDFVPVEEVSGAFVDFVLDSQWSPGKHATTKVLHYCSKAKVKPEELSQYMKKLYGQSIGVVQMSEWLDLALQRGLSHVLYDYLRQVFEDGSQVVLPLILSHGHG